MTFENPPTPREISNPFRGESMDISETKETLGVFERILATRQYSLSENMIWILYLNCSFYSKYVSNTGKTRQSFINTIQIDVKIYNKNTSHCGEKSF